MSHRTEVIGDCTLHLGNCLDVLPTITRVDALITDPPYGVDFIGKRTKHTCATHKSSGGYNGGDSDTGPDVVAKCLELCDRGVVFTGNRMMFDYPKPYEIGCVFCPSGAGLGRWGFTVSHPMLFYGKGLPHSRQGPGGFRSFDVVENNGHPCPKPVRWMTWAIHKCTTGGQSVLDPFMGSGTTGVACVQTGRKFIGIEIDETYFEIACKRIREAVGIGSLFDTERTPDPELFAEACA